MPSRTELPNLKDFRFACDVQLRFNDIDILGHVNNTVYLSLYDLGKARYMEAVNGGVVNWQRVESVIANIDCAFIKQMKFGEEIKVYTRCIHIGEKSYTLQQVLADSNGEIKSVCDTVMVCFDPETGHATDVTPQWRHNLQSFEHNNI